MTLDDYQIELQNMIDSGEISEDKAFQLYREAQAEENLMALVEGYVEINNDLLIKQGEDKMESELAKLFRDVFDCVETNLIHGDFQEKVIKLRSYIEDMELRIRQLEFKQQQG